MELDKAASQISEIHAQLLKSEVFRGYRVWPVAATGILALSAALLQPTLAGACDASEHAWYWMLVAMLCAGLAFADLAFVFWREDSRGQRDRMLKAVGQVLPGLGAGVIVTISLIDAPEAHLLPGLWMLLFSLCLFGSRLFLPRAVGVVGLFYLCCGTLVLLDPLVNTGPFIMGVPFAVGQLSLAVVLQHNLERGRS